MSFCSLIWPTRQLMFDGLRGGLDVVRLELIEGHPESLRFSAPTYLLGWLCEQQVNRVPRLACLRVLLVVEPSKGERGQGRLNLQGDGR